ncbi:MAG: hypothetical protein KC441_10475 [Anaerolineales bacterium]|nr:hypothetical protein [Anaerolineales bacterium]
MTKPSTTYLINLHTLLADYFNLEEIWMLCLNLYVDYESVPGRGKQLQEKQPVDTNSGVTGDRMLIMSHQANHPFPA